MSYPPPYNGPYPPQYLQQISQHQRSPQQPPQSNPQTPYPNLSPNAQYQPQNAKHFAYPQAVPPGYQFPYAQSPSLQQPQQQPQPATARSPVSGQPQFHQFGPPLHYMNAVGGNVAGPNNHMHFTHNPAQMSPTLPQYRTASGSYTPNAAPYHSPPSGHGSPRQFMTATPLPSGPTSQQMMAAPPQTVPISPKVPYPPGNFVPTTSVPSTASVQKMPSNISTPTLSAKQQPVQKPVEDRGPAADVDYQVLLLALADEYLNTAHRRGSLLALSKNEVELEEYYNLVATGLGCLEAVQETFRSEPRTEALVRLRYARILVEETDNIEEAEVALSKGIELCERNKLVDLKYTMQQLLARMLFKSSPKASIKMVDGILQDVETYGHVPWEYAFRLLRVSLALSSNSHQEFVAAVHHLHRLANLANRHGDKPVSVIAAIIEAMAHLQHSTGADAVEQAQRAIAVARRFQLDASVAEIPQLGCMIQFLDVSCSVLDYKLQQSLEKLQVLREMMDRQDSSSRWREDGSFRIPLNSKSAASIANNGDVLLVENGIPCLTMSWLPQRDLYALCFFLSSITLSAKNSHDGRKAEKCLQEGLRMIRGAFTEPEDISESLVAASRRVEWRKVLHANILLQRVFLLCARSDWDAASHALKELRPVAEKLGDALPETVRCLIQYATGVVAQGTGDLAGALAAYESPLLALSPSTNKTMRINPRRDTAILAALNTVHILREPTHPSHSRMNGILAMVEPFCVNSPNPYIQSAYWLVRATAQNDSTIQTKQYLHQALQSAQAINNNQITCITLNFMSWKYFRGVIGEQSEKSARAARHMAIKANDRLWVSVSDAMLAETLERQGKADDARNVREEANMVMTGLPPALKKRA